MLNAAGRKGWRYFCSFGRRVCISFSDSGKQRWREKMRRKWIRNRHSGCQVAVCLCMLVACLMMACCASARALNTPPAGCSLRTKVTKEQYQFPLGTTAWRISGEYGWRKDPLNGKEAFHKGVDLACASGTIVLAGADGIVAAARHSQSYGNYLRLSQAERERLARGLKITLD